MTGSNCGMSGIGLFAFRALTRHLLQIVSTLSAPTIVRDAFRRRAAGACFAMLSQNVLSEEADKRWCCNTQLRFQNPKLWLQCGGDKERASKTYYGFPTGFGVLAPLVRHWGQQLSRFPPPG